MFVGIGQTIGGVGLTEFAGARVSVVTPPSDGSIPDRALLFDSKPLMFDGNFIVYSGV